VIFESEPLRLEASLVTLSPTSSLGYWFDRPPCLPTAKSDELGDLAQTRHGRVSVSYSDTTQSGARPTDR
jgi:hypothetical protein